MLKESGVHTAIETSGFCEWNNLERIIKFTDLVLYDIKHLDPEKHKLFTGVSNEIILKNLKMICNKEKSVIIRVPLIPDINDSDSDLLKIAQIAKENRVIEVHILPFHQMGESKWYSLDMRYLCAEITSPSQERLNRVREIFEEAGISVNIGGLGNKVWRA